MKLRKRRQEKNIKKEGKKIKKGRKRKNRIGRRN